MPAESTPNDLELAVANEFARCRLRRVQVGNGFRIEIHSDRSNSSVLLDAMALDALTRLDPDQISRLLTLVIEQERLDPRRDS